MIDFIKKDEDIQGYISDVNEIFKKHQGKHFRKNKIAKISLLGETFCDTMVCLRIPGKLETHSQFFQIMGECGLSITFAIAIRENEMLVSINDHIKFDEGLLQKMKMFIDRAD